MKTVRLFKSDVYMNECTAGIISIKKDDNGVLLEFDNTVFFPTGGGQTCDTGVIYRLLEPDRPYTVDDVYEDADHIFHHVPLNKSELDHFEDGSGTSCFEIGEQVVQKIDWDRRFDNMQRHCGEHILSGVFDREYGGVNRGFHMGDDYMTIDISLEKDPSYNTITWEMAKRAELLANEVIWKDQPVKAFFFDERKEAEKLPLRKKLVIENDISIVCIGDPASPSDCVACCGTHPSTSGQVGLIKIFKVEPNKGMFRIYCEAGRRAYLDYEEKHDIITEIGRRYSTSASEILNRMDIQEEKNRAARNDLASMRRIVLSARTDDIKQEIEKCMPSQKLIVRSYDDMSPEDVMHIGKAFIGRTDKLVLIKIPHENLVMLFSDGEHFDCNRLVKENAPIYNGKGGGRKDNARSIFPKSEYIDTFADLLEKHLR